MSSKPMGLYCPYGGLWPNRRYTDGLGHATCHRCGRQNLTITARGRLPRHYHYGPRNGLGLERSS